MKTPNTYNSSVSFSMILILIGVGITGLGLICSAQDPTWTKKVNMQNVRQGHSSGVLDESIYVLGGVPGNTPQTHYNAMKSLEIYDPIQNVWNSKAMMENGRVQFPSCVFEGKIYAIGGGQSVYWDPLKSIEVYDPVSGTWTTLEAELPIARMGHTASLVNGKIYIIGGANSNDMTPLSEVDVYDPLTNSWDSPKADLPTPRLNLLAVELNGLIYALGGHRGPQDEELGLATVEAFDPVTDTWSTKAEMNSPRKYFAACVLNEKIYVFGGAKNCYNAWSSVEVYDPVTNTWKEENPFPNEWVMAAAAPFNGKIYVSGGTFQICPPSTISVMYEYDPHLVKIEHIREPLTSIYPNPADNLLNVEISTSGLASIEITSLNGQQILTGEMQGPTHQIDLSTFKKGVYFITIRSKDIVTTRKIIKY